MNKEEALKKINESDSADFEVFGSEEHKTYLDNFKKAEVDPLVAEALSKVHKQYDDDMFEITGKRKDGQEKTYDFLKREFNDLKEQNKSAEPLKAKIKELEQAIKDNSGDERLRLDLQNVQDKYKEEKDLWEAEKTKHTDSLNTYKLGTELDKAMIGFEFKKDIPQTVVDTFIAQVKTELLKTAEIVDGVMIFTEDGKTLRNKNNAMNPYTAKELLAQRLEGILAKSVKVDGPIKPKKEKDKDGKEITTLPDPGAKTLVEVTNYLKENGIPQGSDDYNRMFEEFGKDLPIQ